MTRGEMKEIIKEAVREIMNERFQEELKTQLTYVDKIVKKHLEEVQKNIQKVVLESAYKINESVKNGNTPNEKTVIKEAVDTFSIDSFFANKQNDDNLNSPHQGSYIDDEQMSQFFPSLFGGGE